MSNDVFPTLPGRAWPRKRTPLWKTKVNTTPSGREFRSTAMAYPRYRITWQYELLRSKASQQDFQALVGFINARRGAFDTFLLDDPDDNTVTGQPFGTGDGTTTTFQLVRSVGGYAEPVAMAQSGAVASVSGVPAINLLAPHSSFEVDTNADGLADGWAQYVVGSFGSAANSLQGGGVYNTYLQQCTATALGTASTDRVGVSKVNVPVVEGLAYTLSAWVRGTVGVGATLFAEFVSSGGSTLGLLSNSAIILAATWDRPAVSGIAPAGTVKANVYVWAHSRPGSAGAATLDVDAVQMQVAAAATDYSPHYGAFAIDGTVSITPAPPAAAPLTWTGKFYHRVRFDADEITFDQFMHQFWKTGEIKFITVKP